jgi:acyl-CoA synthetase (AMP-forming)/AMP-acid ligase II
VHELWDEQAAATPTALAVRGLERNLTFDALASEVLTLAGELQRRGVTPEQCIGIYLPHCEEYIIANLAIFKAGGAMFLLETNYTPQLLADFMAAGELVQVVTNSAMLAKLPASYPRDQIILLDGPNWVSLFSSSFLCLFARSPAFLLVGGMMVGAHGFAVALYTPPLRAPTRMADSSDHQLQPWH